MLSEVNLSKKIDKNEYKLKIKPLKTELEIFNLDRKSTRLNSSHVKRYRMPSSA